MENSEEQRYCVVLDTLTEKRNKLWKMTSQNMDCGCFNIMDQIRLDHIEKLDQAIKLWKNNKEL